MKNADITFVLQGPIIENVTKKSIKNIRELFPSSPIVLSTWKGECISDLDVDLIIENEDPGSTIISFGRDNKPRTVNVNRQIKTTISGLKAVDTEYAVKLRTDNILHSNQFPHYLEKYTAKNDKYSLFKEKIIYSNFFAKEMTKGLKIPYFFSDFFHFGKTTDLISLWDIKYFENYEFKECYTGKFQHKQYPMRCSHVEQDLWLSFMNKKVDKPVSLMDEFGTKKDVEDSYHYLLNNTIMLNGEQIGLEVPRRLEQPNQFPYEFYEHMRWRWLYENYFNLESTIPLSFKISWLVAYMYKRLIQGIRYTIKSKYLWWRFNTIVKN